MHLAVLYAVLHPLCLSLELPGFTGCEMYQYQSRQYLEIVSLILIWETIPTISVINTEHGLSQNACAAEARLGGDGQ